MTRSISEPASNGAGPIDRARIERTSDRAYVVVPAVYSFKQRGAAMREAAQMTFVLKKSAAGSWLIDAWTWTGPKAQAAAAPAKK